ncbi:hypothetical protein OUZ56_005823 [Daphnia magna]|uniref:Uncharacterized protein n=1 Tax=Daphnia magna TaxID=35525 RepID=A0ABQ9YTV7_9CRUS|nr:hypothetical protein OUZ56_005823 [Daphnia magna]
MTNALARVAAVFTLLLVVQLSASASVKGRPVASVVKTEPEVKAVKAPQVVASDPVPAKVQQKTAVPVQKEKTVELVQKEKVVEPVPQTSADAPQKLNVDATKSAEDAKKAEVDAGHHIQGDGPFVVNAQQLPPDVREEIMRQLNTQYRLSQEKKQQQKQQTVKGHPGVQVKSDYVPTPENESFDPELAAGIAELLTRMAVEDDVGNQYIDLEELPAALKLQVTEYLTKQQTMDEQKEVLEQLKLQQHAEKVKAQEASFASLLNKQTDSQIDELLSSLLQGYLEDYPGPAAGYYPQRLSPYAYPQRPAFPSRYPPYGVQPQYGGYPGGNQYHGSFRPYSGLAAYPSAALGGFHPASYGIQPYVLQSSLMAREPFPQLYDRSVATKPLPHRTIGGPLGSFLAVPLGYVENLKPEDQPNPLAAYYAYYRQLYESQSRIHPADLAVQQPRPYVNYKFRRY